MTTSFVTSESFAGRRFIWPQRGLARSLITGTAKIDNIMSAFVHLMEFEARGRANFLHVRRLCFRAKIGDRCRGEIMSSVYRGLLRKMELDKFRVFEKEYRLNKLEKAAGSRRGLLKIC